MTTRTRAAALAALAVPSLAAAALLAGPAPASAAGSPQFEAIGSYQNAGAEVSAVLGNRLYVINAAGLDIVDISSPAAPALIRTIPLGTYGPEITSVDASYGANAGTPAQSKSARVAVSIPAASKTAPGTVVLMDADGTIIGTATVGANPDMVVFDARGQRLVVANEGEPNAYAGATSVKDDPEGSVSIITVPSVKGNGNGAVRTVAFTDFNVGGTRHAELPAGVRIFGPGASVAEDLEPEYVAIDGERAFVTLQENNAIAEIDLRNAKVVAIRDLALKDHSLTGAGLDPSDKDGGIKIAPWSVVGVPMPDGIATFTAGGQTYLITANEGDARADWPGYNEEVRLGKATPDPSIQAAFDAVKADAKLGRLNLSIPSSDTDGDGDIDRFAAFGTRSATIWRADGTRVWDSGDQLEQATATRYPSNFNASNDNNKLDDRSDNKGPEPEGVAIGVIAGRTYAFVGLERIGGFAVFDVTDPTAPTLVQYANNRDFSAAVTSATPNGPEVIRFVDAASSPNGKPLVIVNNEVSHTVTLWSPTS